MGHDMQRRILEGIRADEDSELQMYATEPSGSMSEEGDGEREYNPGDSVSVSDINPGDKIRSDTYGEMYVVSDDGMNGFWSSEDESDVEAGRGRILRYAFVDAWQPGATGPWYKLEYFRDDDLYMVRPDDFNQDDDLEESEGKDGWPKKLEKGRFTEYCKRNGFEGPCVACARKAMKSDDASVRGMATFYMNTVKPGGKTSSDVAAKEESVTEKGDPMKFAMPSDEENRLRSEYMAQFRADVEELRALKDAGKKDTPEWKALVDRMNDREAEYARADFRERQKRINAMIMSDFEDEPTEEAVREDDGWVSLEEMQQECAECADRMRSAGMTRIRRSQVDECRKPPIEESAWRSYGR